MTRHPRPRDVIYAELRRLIAIRDQHAHGVAWCEKRIRRLLEDFLAARTEEPR